MDTTAIGTQGLRVSRQGLGCMGMGNTYGPSDDVENLSTLARAVDLGITFFDTAEVYGPYINEELLGRGLRARGPDICIATKVGFVFTPDGKLALVDGKPIVTGNPGRIRKAVEGSIARLGTDRIDLLYLHRVDPETPIEDTVGALSDLVREGKVRFIGLSEASPATIRRAHAVHPLTAVQTEYSLFERGVERNGVLAAVRELGIGFVSYSPLGRGFLSGSFKDLDTLPPGDFRRTDPRFQGENLRTNIELVDRIAALAAAKGITASQLAIAWTMAAGTVPIPGTRRTARVEENVAAASIVLTDADLEALDGAAPVDAAAGPRYSPGMMRTLEE